MIRISNKNIVATIFFVVILAILSCGAIAYKSYWTRSPLDESSIIENVLESQVSYIINYEEGNIDEYEIDASENSTVFSLLEELARRENFDIETDFYPEMGIFIESIGEAKGGTDNKWWQYWVNGNLGEVAADKKNVKAGDLIEWEFEAPEF